MMFEIAGGILLAVLALFVLACVLVGIASAVDRPRPVRYAPPPPPPLPLRQSKLNRRTVLLGFLLLVGLSIALNWLLYGRIPG
jgi:hypothetical protein